jgi:tRNA 2-selenouridine synthase SelU
MVVEIHQQYKGEHETRRYSATRTSNNNAPVAVACPRGVDKERRWLMPMVADSRNLVTEQIRR